MRRMRAMANTMFGIIELGKVSDHKSLPNSTFRLHIGSGTSEADIFHGCFPKEVVLGNYTTVTIHFGPYPSAGLIYERELHVSKAKNRNGHDVLILKEGSRFLETPYNETFLYMLGLFLSQSIAELAELIAFRSQA